jgi:hypothetical protein
MEIKQVEVQPSAAVPTTPSAPPPQAPILKPTPSPGVTHRDSLDELYADPASPPITARSAAVEAVTQPAVEGTEAAPAVSEDSDMVMVDSEAIYVDGVAHEDEKAEPSTEPSIEPSNGEPAPDKTTANPTEAEPSVPALEEPAPMKTISNVRIAFIGLPQSSDEWIDLSSDRLQKLNSCSFGRRGKVIGVREEILHLVKTCEPVEIPASDKFATVWDGSFQHPAYVELINLFGTQGGFNIIQDKLQLELVEKGLRPPNGSTETAAPTAEFIDPHSALPASRPPVEAVKSWPALLTLISAVGPTHRVLRRDFVRQYAPRFLEDTTALLRDMSLADIRETSVEAIEAALTSMEQIAIAHLGKTAAMGELIEPLRLHVAIMYLQSPFLNRRLGGLKLLSELVRQAELTVEHPSGWKVTRTVMPDGVEDVTYRVLSVLYHLTLRDICQQLLDCGALEQIFVGHNAHESLMSRAHPVVSALAAERCVSADLLTAISTAGFSDNKPEALQCLSHMLSRLPLDDDHIHTLLDIVRKREPSALTASVVDIAAAVALRCRDVLYAAGEVADTNAAACAEWYAQRSPGHMAVEENGANTASALAEVAHLRSVFAIHAELLDLFWAWTSDTSGVSDAVVNVCFDKLEAILSAGVTSASALKRPDFPWAMHWYRMSHLASKATQTLAKLDSVHRAIKCLQLLLNAWPFYSTTEPAAHTDRATLPFGHPNRGALMAYLQKQYDVIALITSTAVAWKQAFLPQALALAHSSDWGRIFTSVEDLCSGQHYLSMSTETKLNTLTVGSARCGYLQQLAELCDFLHVAVRSIDTLEFTFETMDALYRAVILSPVTADEVDTVVSFLQRVITKVADSTTSSSAFTASNNSSNGNTDTAVSEGKRTAVSSYTAIYALFTRRFCDKNGFIRSRFFNIKAFQCIEKWFKYLNGRPPVAGTDAQALQRDFRQSGNPDDIVGIDLLPCIVLTCTNDRVASAAVKFLTTLPQVLPDWGRHSASAVAFRNMLLSRCMSELSTAAEAARASHASFEASTALSRALLFLDGILEESLSMSGGEVTQHGKLGRGQSITFKVHSTHKAFTALGMPRNLTMYMNETVHDLFKAVADMVSMDVRLLKIFRLGHELHYVQERDKTIGLLNGIEKEQHQPLVVTAKVFSPKVSHRKHLQTAEEQDDTAMEVQESAHSSVDPAFSMTESTHTDAPSMTEASGRSTPAPPAALILARTPEYFNLLFSLLQTSEGAICDRLWGLLTRIPTSAVVLQGWVHLDCPDVSALLLSFDRTTWSNISTLLYNLQLVELLLQPASSPDDLEAQRRFIKDVDHELLQSWVARFLQKGGVRALCDAFEWIHQATRAYLQQADKPPAGVTVHLLHHATSLITKLMRAFLLRACNAQSKEHAAAVNAALLDFLPAGAAAKPHGPALPPSADTTDAMDTTPATVTPAPDAELKDEWGWRIDQAAKLEGCSPSLWLQGVDITSLQQASLSCMVCLRKLSEQSYYATNVLADNAAKNATMLRQVALLTSQDNLLIMWMATSALSANEDNAETVNERIKECAQRIVDELILGQVPGARAPKTITASAADDADTSAIENNWYIRAVGRYLIWLQKIATVGSTSDGSYHALRRELLRCIMERRPSLVVSSPRETPPAENYKQLFALADALLESTDTTPILEVENLRAAYMAIFSELQELHHQLATSGSSSDRAASVSYLNESIALFVALCLRVPDSGAFLHKPSTLEFILRDCLGLVGIASSASPCICSEDQGRYFHTLSISTLLMCMLTLMSLPLQESAVLTFEHGRGRQLVPGPDSAPRVGDRPQPGGGAGRLGRAPAARESLHHRLPRPDEPGLHVLH